MIRIVLNALMQSTRARRASQRSKGFRGTPTARYSGRSMSLERANVVRHPKQCSANISTVDQRPGHTEVVMLQYVKTLLRDERGVSSLEYAVLAGIVVVALAAVGTVLSGSSGLSSIFTTLINKVSSLI